MSVRYWRISVTLWGSGIAGFNCMQKADGEQHLHSLADCKHLSNTRVFRCCVSFLFFLHFSNFPFFHFLLAVFCFFLSIFFYYHFRKLRRQVFVFEKRYNCLAGVLLSSRYFEENVSGNGKRGKEEVFSNIPP